jgi:hypothetical protein
MSNFFCTCYAAVVPDNTTKLRVTHTDEVDSYELKQLHMSLALCLKFVSFIKRNPLLTHTHETTVCGQPRIIMQLVMTELLSSGDVEVGCKASLEPPHSSLNKSNILISLRAVIAQSV